MSTRSSPTSSRSERNATCTTPSGASAPDPVALHRRDAEEHHRGDPEVGECSHLLAEALLGVLEHARHRRHRFGRADAFLHEEGRPDRRRRRAYHRRVAATQAYAAVAATDARGTPRSKATARPARSDFESTGRLRYGFPGIA
jgi:hypothetical protein